MSIRTYFLTAAIAVSSLALSVAAYAQTDTTAPTAKKIESGFAIQNVQTGKNIRPYEARGNDGNKIVLYDNINWKCMTWKMIKVGDDNTYQLRNLLTRKTIQPSAAPKDGVSLYQQPLKSDATQNPQWEFLKQADGAYLVRLKGTDLYLTISSDETNSLIVLVPKKESKDSKDKTPDKSQEWKLVEQSPLY